MALFGKKKEEVKKTLDTKITVDAEKYDINDFSTVAKENNYEYSVNADGVSCTLHKILKAESTLILPAKINGLAVTVLQGVDDESLFDVRARQNVEKVIKVVIPDTVKRIGKHAFYGCKDIEIIEVGQNVETIDLAAFAYCMSIKRMVLPKSVKYIGDYAFKGCASLRKLTITNPECEIYDNTYTVYTDSNTSAELGNFAGIIYAPKDSTAEQYAIANKKTFRVLCKTGINAIYTGNNLDVGELIDKDKIEVYALYSNDTRERVYEFELLDTSFLDFGNHDVRVTHENLETIFNVFVKGRVLMDLEASYIGKPVTRGMKFNKNDIKVVGVYDDGSREDITTFTVEDDNIMQIGKNKVMVFYESQMIPVVVEGVGELITGITATYSKGHFYLGNSLPKEDVKVVARFNNGTTSEISNFKLSRTEFEVEGDYEVKVIVTDNIVENEEGMLCDSFTVRVLPYEVINLPEFLENLKLDATHIDVGVAKTEEIERLNVPSEAARVVLQKKKDGEYLLKIQSTDYKYYLELNLSV